MNRYRRLQTLLVLLLASCSQQAPPEETAIATSAVTTVETRVAASLDDAEEQVPTGTVNPSSDDLELTVDGSVQQLVGLRFNRLSIPQGATITRAYVQFTVDEAKNVTGSLTIKGQAVDNAPAFAKVASNVSSRAATATSVNWTPPAWTVVGAAGVDQQTPDLKAVVQEVVNRSGWVSGNAIALVITGTGRRVAVAYDGVKVSAPLLHVEYSTDGTTPAQYALTVSKAGTGSGTVTGLGINCGSDCSEVYAAGTQVTLTAAPTSGSTFAGWSGGCTGTGACTVTMSSAKAVTATFNATTSTQYTLNVNKAGSGSGTVSGTGIACGGDCSETYNAGTQVTLTATAASGSTFAGWSGACSGTGSCALTMNSSKTVTATFNTSSSGGQGTVAAIAQANVFLTGYSGGTASGTPLTIPSTDPAGIGYNAQTGRLFIADSEIDELPVFSTVQANVFEVSLDGSTLYNKYNITPSSKGNNKEPVGIAYCANDNRYYVSHDNTPNGVWRYNLVGGTATFEDQTNTPKARDSDTTTKDDPEDVTCDAATGLLYVVNGAELNILVYRYDPSYSEPNTGPSARTTTTSFRLERTIDLVSTAGDPSGIPSDPEGIGFDPVSKHLFVTSAPEKTIFEYTTAGVFVKKFSMSSFSPATKAPQGITVAPSSDGSGRQSFYIADGGVDNDQDANERDGRIYEAVITRQ